MSSESKISARHALTEQELDFCKRYEAMGRKNHTEAYRRAFWPRYKDSDGRWVLPEHQDLPPPKEVSRRATRLLDQDYILAYLEELRQTAGDRARDVLSEQVQFEVGRPAAQAAAQILQQEDKLGFRDAVEKYAEIMSAIGAEVVVPAPGGGEVSFPLREMYPRFSESLPPADVLLKTENALREYREKVEAADEGE